MCLRVPEFIGKKYEKIIFSASLKLVCNENQGGSGRWHTFGIGLGPWRSMFFWLYVFPFPPSKPQFLADVPMNRQNTPNCSPTL